MDAGSCTGRAVPAFRTWRSSRHCSRGPCDAEAIRLPPTPELKGGFDLTRTNAVGAALALGFIAASTAPIGAQVCGDLIVNCQAGGESWHNFNENTPTRREFQDQGYHGTCNICTSGGEEVSATVCHPGCTGFADENEQLAFEALLEVARSGDAQRILMAARRVPARIRLNGPRRSLQIVGCQGEIIGNLPLGHVFDEAVVLGLGLAHQPVPDPVAEDTPSQGALVGRT